MSIIFLFLTFSLSVNIILYSLPGQETEMLTGDRSTGPTSLMTFYVAGIHLTSSKGQTWSISPVLGDLTFVEGGFSTSLGEFTSSVTALNGIVSGLNISTPVGTSVGAPFPFSQKIFTVLLAGRNTTDNVRCRAQYLSQASRGIWSVRSKAKVLSFRREKQVD